MEFVLAIPASNELNMVTNIFAAYKYKKIFFSDPCTHACAQSEFRLVDEEFITSINP